MIELHNEDSKKVFEQIVKDHSDRDIILVSDPPFNVGYKYNTYKDNMGEKDYYDMLSLFFSNLPSVVIHYPESLYKLAIYINKCPERVISWVYNSNLPIQHRDIAFFGIKPDMSKIKQPYKNLSDKRIQQRIADGNIGTNLYDWWYIQQVKNISKEKTEHPCQMPLEVMKRIVGVLPDNALIIDPFMGSGTTGVAVRIMNEEQGASRGFIGIEIDKDYYNIAEQRVNGKIEKEFDKLYQEISLF